MWTLLGKLLAPNQLNYLEWVICIICDQATSYFCLPPISWAGVAHLGPWIQQGSGDIILEFGWEKKYSFIFTHKSNWNLAFSSFVNIGNKSWCINNICDFCHPQNYRYSPILHHVVVGTGRPHFIVLHFIALHRYCMFSFLQIKVLWQPWVVRWWLAFFY